MIIRLELLLKIIKYETLEGVFASKEADTFMVSKV